MSRTKEEKRREQKKISMRRAREKLRKNPVALEAEREKDRQRKMLGRKKISEIKSEREKRAIRKR